MVVSDFLNGVSMIVVLCVMVVHFCMCFYDCVYMFWYGVVWFCMACV